MKCKFCNNELFLLKPAVGAATPQQRLYAYDCYRCPRSVRFFYTEDQLDGYIIFINRQDRNINNHLYAVVFRPNEDKASLYTVAHVGYSAGYLEGFKMHQSIAEFGHIPNITPSNISDKLKLYMLFS